jgi:hypothetical protein
LDKKQFHHPVISVVRRLGQVPSLGQKLFDRYFANAFLHTQFIVQEVIGNSSALAVYAVNPNPVAIAVGTDQADFQIARRDFSNRAPIYLSHHDPLDAQLGKTNAARTTDRPPLPHARFAVIIGKAC